MKTKKSRQVILAIVFLILGYMVAYSYHLTQQEEVQTITSSQWERDIELRDQLIEIEERNRELQNELVEKQEIVFDMERQLAEQERAFADLASETELFRIFLGKVRVKGPGVTVTLRDGQYDPQGENINNYIVHEHHVFRVVNELYISGASVVAINGQRLSSNSYIVCNGPVIEVDGTPHPAPFRITAIGDPEVLSAALNLPGGVKDILVNENIEFKLEKESEIIFEPNFTS